MANQQPQQKAPQKQRTASERIEGLENVASALYQSASSLTRDMAIVKDAIKLLGNKVDALVKALAAQAPINDDTIAKYMVENNVNELKGKVADLVAQGILKASEDTVAAEDFIVGQEIAIDTDDVVNPRMQFVVSSLTDEKVRNAMIGSIAGDILTIAPDKLRFRVLEVYKVIIPEAPAAQPTETPAEAPKDVTPAAPALAAVPDAAPEAEVAPAQS